MYNYYLYKNHSACYSYIHRVCVCKYVYSNEICYFVHTTQESALLVVLGTYDLTAPTKYK